jgi:serine/threonine protein kinase
MPLFQLPPLPTGTGEVIDDDHLIQLIEIIGPLPVNLLSQWQRVHLHFTETGERRPAHGNPINELVKKMMGLRGDAEIPTSPPQPYPSLRDIIRENKPDDLDPDDADQMLQLLQWILRHEPSRRPTAVELLRHQWFQG